jgi:hypothetical protein
VFGGKILAILEQLHDFTFTIGRESGHQMIVTEYQSSSGRKHCVETNARETKYLFVGAFFFSYQLQLFNHVGAVESASMLK